MMRQATYSICLLTTLAGCHLPLRPDSGALAPWTTELRAKQPEDAFGAVYARGQSRLVFIGAHHTEEIDSLTFRMINDAYASFDIRTVLVEGVPRSRGPNDDDIQTPALIDAELARNRERLGLSATILPGYAAWADWYARTNGKVFGAKFELEETGPLADGRYESNRIAAAISRSRDTFLLDAIAERLNAGETLLVVFGASHLMIQRPALDAMLGPPCYAGSEVSSAAASGC